MTKLTKLTKSTWLPLFAFGPLVALVACGDGTAPAPSGRLAEELHFLRPAASAPPLATTEVSFWAKRGEDREVRVRYEPLPGASDTAEFLRFSVPSAALERRPDGTAFAAGDDKTCKNWTSSTQGAAFVGHSDRQGLRDDEPSKSWNSSHTSRGPDGGCSQADLKSTGGDGLLYCFAAN